MNGENNNYQIKKKPPGESRDSLTTFVRKTFKERASQVSKRDIQRVEYFINLGKRQLQTVTNSEVDGFSLFGQKEKTSQKKYEQYVEV